MIPPPITSIEQDPQSASITKQLVTPIQSFRDEDNGIRVLHVDDEPDFADMAATFLERVNPDLTVIPETTADDAIRFVKNDSIDCVVSDYEMPELDGLDFLEHVRETDPDLPFILFTGKGSEDIASEAITRGVTDYLQKEGGTDQYAVLANRIINSVKQYYAERDLWIALSWYQRLVEQNLAGIYLIQQDEFIYVNQKFAEIFGYSQDDLIGESPLIVVAEEDHETVQRNLESREAGDIEEIQYSLTGITKDGTRVSLDVHGGVIEFEGQPAVLGILLESTP